MDNVQRSADIVETTGAIVNFVSVALDHLVWETRHEFQQL